jgi:hypothetical protein
LNNTGLLFGGGGSGMLGKLKQIGDESDNLRSPVSSPMMGMTRDMTKTPTLTLRDDNEDGEEMPAFALLQHRVEMTQKVGVRRKSIISFRGQGFTEYVSLYLYRIV